jgi:AcrR family transcriptional regulator
MERKIINAFLELCLEKSKRKVAVKAICEKAGIARSTFYQYYEDAEQLLALLEERTLGDIDEIVKLWPYVDVGQIARNGIFPPSREIYCYIYDNMALFRVLFMDTAYFSRCVDNARKCFQEQFHNSNAGGAKVDFWAVFIAGGIYHNILEWINGDIQISPEEMACLATRAVSVVFDTVLEHGDVFGPL